MSAPTLRRVGASHNNLWLASAGHCTGSWAGVDVIYIAATFVHDRVAEVVCTKALCAPYVVGLPPSLVTVRVARAGNRFVLPEEFSGPVLSSSPFVTIREVRGFDHEVLHDVIKEHDGSRVSCVLPERVDVPFRSIGSGDGSHRETLDVDSINEVITSRKVNGVEFPTAPCDLLAETGGCQERIVFRFVSGERPTDVITNIAVLELQGVECRCITHDVEDRAVIWIEPGCTVAAIADDQFLVDVGEDSPCQRARRSNGWEGSTGTCGLVSVCDQLVLNKLDVDVLILLAPSELGNGTHLLDGVRQLGIELPVVLEVGQTEEFCLLAVSARRNRPVFGAELDRLCRTVASGGFTSDLRERSEGISNNNTPTEDRICVGFAGFVIEVATNHFFDVEVVSLNVLANE